MSNTSKLWQRPGLLIFILVALLTILLVRNSEKRGEPTPIQQQKNAVQYVSIDTAVKEKEKISEKSNKKIDSSLVTGGNTEHISSTKIIMNQWLTDAENIVDDVPSDEIYDIFDFLQEKMIPASPYALKDSVVNFIIISPDDSLPQSKFWQQVKEDNNAGINFYSMMGKTLLVFNASSLKISPMMRGILLLFQGKLALFNYVKPLGFNTEENKTISIDRLLKAHEMKNKIFLALGGKQYKHFLETEMFRLQDEIEKHDKPLDIFFPGQIDYSDSLYSLFQAKTVFEKQKVAVYFHNHATFALLEKNYQGNELLVRKKLYINNLYY